MVLPVDATLRSPMLCEKLVHGDRAYMPFPEFYRIENGQKRPIAQKEFPYKCLRRARMFRVSGQSFSCTAILCEQHKEAAIREGFTLEEIEEPQQ